MVEPLAQQVIRHLDRLPSLYHRLVLVVGPSGSGKTSALQEAQEQTNGRLLNLNLELSRLMLDLTTRQRALQLPRVLNELVKGKSCEAVFLDNIEILFDVSLRQDPLRLLQGLSRTKSLVAAWNGTIQDNQLNYAAPGHQEFRRYAVQDFLVASV